MGWIKKTGLGLGGIIVLGALGGYVWFWGAPVGVNNYIIKPRLKWRRIVLSYSLLWG